jgi:S1-C subfamily serine protease
MRRMVLYLGTLAALTVASLAPSGPTSAAAQVKGEDIAERMLRSTAFILRPRPDKMVGGKVPFNRGTGALIINSGGRRIVLTNFHVVGRPIKGEPHRVFVMFPVRKPNGEVISEVEKYLDALEDPRVSFVGTVLDAVPDVDLALIELNKQQPLPAHLRPLPLAERSPRPAATVHTMGNPGASGLWSYTRGEVRTVFEKRMAFILEGERITVQARVIDTTNPINKGDSGGPLVNDKMEIVGVAQSISTEAQAVSTFIAIEEVWKLLDKNKLRGLVARGGTIAAGDGPKPTEAAKPLPSAAASDTAPDDPQKAERHAAAKLRQAKIFMTDGQTKDALEILADVIERWPDTKAAAEAKRLQREWKKP